MHIKNNNKTRTFIQGLRPFSSSIPKTLKKYLKKGGYNYSSIIDNWMRIVPRNISNSSYPITIKISKEMRDGNLILNVSHGKELEIEYAKNEIIDKVNSFFIIFNEKSFSKKKFLKSIHRVKSAKMAKWHFFAK